MLGPGVPKLRTDLVACLLPRSFCRERERESEKENKNRQIQIQIIGARYADAKTTHVLVYPPVHFNNSRCSRVHVGCAAIRALLCFGRSDQHTDHDLLGGFS